LIKYGEHYAMATAPAPQLDDLFSALADPTRRAIVERLIATGELSVGEIAAPFTVSTPAISRHLQVLERAGLIERRTEQQWRYARVRADALAPVESWLSRQRRQWTAALDRLEALAAVKTPQRKKS
jgi:DNA-binding transcriptional ArsR family regulator